MKTSKRIVSLLLVLTMLLGVFCVSVAAEETTAPVTATVTYNSNYPADSGMTDQVPGTDTATAGYKLRDCAEWGWEYPDGYTLQGWSNGTTYAVGAEISLDGSLNFNAVWKKTASSTPETPDAGEDEDDTDVPANAPKAPAVGTRFYNAIFVNCTDNDHDEYYSWIVDKTYTPKWNERYQVWYITATVKNLDNYLPGYRYNYGYDYGYDYDCNYHCDHNYTHTCTKYCSSNCQYKTCKECDIITTLFGSYFEVSNSTPYYDRYNSNYSYNYYGHKITGRDSTVTLQWRYNRWYVVDSAVLRVTCGSYNNTTKCNSNHSHTVRFTDGVANQVIFKDKTYTVRHNGKTPSVQNPVREGYRFAGWSPKVTTYVTECVVYEAQWVSDSAPALTTDHVAYLKGYGKGYVRPEYKVTRAEAATMLFRLLDAESLREYYTAYNNFSDVNAGDWYNDAVSTLTNAGIIKGYAGGKYNPNEEISRAELTAMLSRLAYGETSKTSSSKFNDVSTTYWAYDEIAKAQELGWIKGYGGNTFNPDASISRAEVAAILNRMLDRDDCNVKDTKNYVDNPANAWYYRDILEASIAH